MIRSADMLIQALGWTLLHSIWQFLLVSLGVGLMLQLIRNASSRMKYRLACVGMIICFVWAGLTFIGHLQPAQVLMTHTDSPGIETILPAIPVGVESDWLNSWTGRIGFSLISAITWLAKNISLLCLTWLIGVIFFSIRNLGGLFYIRKIIRSSKMDPSGRMQRIVKRLVGAMNIRRKVRIYEAVRLQVPIVSGVVKPVILVPLGFISGIPPNQVEAILAHELAHIKRYDYLVNIFQTVLEVIFFYHPAIWWLSNAIRKEREHCCDDMALTVCEGKSTLINALSSIQKLYQPNKNNMVAFSNNKMVLLRRMQRLVREDRETSFSIVLPLLMITLLLGFLALKPATPAMMTQTEPTASKPGYSGIFINSGEKDNPTARLQSPWPIVGDTLQNPEGRGGKMKQNEPNGEEGRDSFLDVRTDELDSDLDIQIPAFADTVYFEWPDIAFENHFDTVFKHFEFHFPENFFSDSLPIYFEDLHVDMEDFFKDFKHDFPEMNFCDTISIDKDALRKNMEELKDKMEFFKSDAFRKEMDRAMDEMKESMDRLNEEMKLFREEEWPRIMEEIRKAMDDHKKQEFKSRSDSLIIQNLNLRKV